jgi:hypothetical protein
MTQVNEPLVFFNNILITLKTLHDFKKLTKIIFSFEIIHQCNIFALFNHAKKKCLFF